MNFKQFHFTPDTSSTDTWKVFPTWDFREERIKALNKTRSIGSELNDYRNAGSYLRYSMPFTIVSSLRGTEINSLWQAQSNVFLTLNMSSNPETIKCRIANRSEPLNKRTQANINKYEGIAFLKSTDASSLFSGCPLIADNAVFGISDDVCIAV